MGRGALGRCLVAFAVALVPLVPSPAAAAPAPPKPIPGWQVGQTWVTSDVAPTEVVVSELPAASAADLKAPKSLNHRALLVKDAPAYAAAKRTPKGLKGTAIPQKKTAAAAPPAPNSAKAPLAPSPFPLQFPGISLNQQLTTTGDGAEPSDTQLAAGPTTLVELVNVSGQVFHKDGTVASSLFRLATFFGFPSTYFPGDPRVLFDPSTQRWYATALGFNGSGGSQVRLNVSRTSNPLGTWSRYVVYSSSSVLCDQPKLGYSSDKFIVGCTDYNGNTFVGGVIIVASKVQAMAGATLTLGHIGPDAGLFGLVPAQNVDPGQRGYFIANNVTFTGVATVDGNPALGFSHVSFAGYSVPMTPTTLPPGAPQNGTTSLVDTGDDRFMSAVVQGGKLWTSGGTGCTPAGDTAVRACVKILRIRVSSTSTLNPPTNDLDTTTGFVGKYLFYPTLGLDANGNAAIDYSLSSASEYPSHGALFQRSVDTVPTDQGLFQTGTGFYTGSRWGDYGAAAADPAEPTRVWLAGGYSDGTTTFTHPNWNTGIGTIAFTKLTLSLTGAGFGPQPVGTTSGTQTLTVTNSGDFDAHVTSGMSTGDTSQFSVANNTCATATLVPAATCTADFTFHPTSTGLKIARFNVSAPHYGPLALVLSGSGIGPACASAGISGGATSPQNVGVTVTLTATSSGCPNPSPLYWFRLRSPAGVWSTVRSYTSSATFDWHTTGYAPGTYLIAALVKDAASTAPYDVYAYGTFTLQLPYCTSTNISADKSSPRASGTTITFTATNTGCPNALYQWWLNRAGVWSVVPNHDYAHSTDTFVWNTGGLPDGTYIIGLWAKQVGSAKTYDAYANLTYTLVVVSGTTKCQGVSIAPSGPSPSDAGTTVTLTATVSGCDTPQFKWWVRDTAGVFHVVADYPAGTNTYSWTSSTPGTYFLDVWVRQSGSTALYEAYAYISYTLTVPPAAQPCSAVTLTPSVPSPQAPSTTVTFTGAATGCASAVYRFFVAPPGGALVQSQPYGASTFDWHTSGLAAGIYQVEVLARRTGSIASYEAYALITFQLQPVVTPCNTLSLFADPSLIVPDDRLNRIQIGTSFGCPTPTYRLYLRYGAGAFVFWGYPDPASTTFTVTLTGMAGGHWTAAVLVKDASSTAAYDSAAYTDFQVR